MERMTKFRVGVFLVLVAAMVFFFGLRAYNVQVVNATVSDNSISTDTYTTAVSAARGQILDRNGNILVSNRASYNLIINGYVLYNSDNPNESLRQLTRLCKSLGLNYAEHLPVSLKKPYEYTLDGYPEAWQSYFHQYLSARSWDSDISAQQLVKLMKNSYHIPNDWEEEDCRRVIGLRYELELVNVANLPTYALLTDVDSDSLAKVKADSVRKMIQEGKYVQRAKYDKSNFDSWKIDTVFQKSMKESIYGIWRTPIVAHGHAFRDAELRFDMNDTVYGTTRTYSDSGRYQMTGEYTFKARYRFDNDTSMVTREVFADRQVVRWDYIAFRKLEDTLTYNLKKLEFRDMNDNWLNALQGFDNVPPEVYIKDEKLTAEMKKTAELWAKRKK